MCDWCFGAFAAQPQNTKNPHKQCNLCSRDCWIGNESVNWIEKRVGHGFSLTLLNYLEGDITFGQFQISGKLYLNQAVIIPNQAIECWNSQRQHDRDRTAEMERKKDKRHTGNCLSPCVCSLSFISLCWGYSINNANATSYCRYCNSKSSFATHIDSGYFQPMQMVNKKKKNISRQTQQAIDRVEHRCENRFHDHFDSMLMARCVCVWILPN